MMGQLKKRSFGIVVVESVMSNYNGNPDEDNTPRLTNDGFGLISPVCFKHRVRELLEDHNGVTWDHFKSELGLDDKSFHIWESSLKGYDVDNPVQARKEWIKIVKAKGEDALVQRFWDMRVFGTTALEDKKKVKDTPLQFKRTGCVSVSPFLSLLPVEIISQTITKGNPLRPELMEKDQGDIAPFGMKVARHAVFTGNYVINPSVAHYTNTTEKDIKVFKALVPHALSNSTAASRSGVRILQVIHATHDNPLCSFNESKFNEFCRPIASGNLPSVDLNSYTFRTLAEIKKEFPGVKVEMIVDASSKKRK